MSQWNSFDLLATAPGQQTGHDFSGGMCSKVVFDGLNLTGTKWNNTTLVGASFQSAVLDGATGLNGTDLTQAAFNWASLKQVNLSVAKLYGAMLRSDSGVQCAVEQTQIATNDPKASYQDDATYTPKAADICERNLAW